MHTIQLCFYIASSHWQFSHSQTQHCSQKCTIFGPPSPFDSVQDKRPADVLRKFPLYFFRLEPAQKCQRAGTVEERAHFLGKLYAEFIVALRLVDTWCVFLTDTLVGLCIVAESERLSGFPSRNKFLGSV